MPRNGMIGITKGMRGWYAVHYDNDGPVQSGLGSYATPEEAAREAEEWAESERMMLDPAAREYIDRREAQR
jgi:hypothetical protein